jgi:hypothetical protein
MTQTRANHEILDHPNVSPTVNCFDVFAAFKRFAFHHQRRFHHVPQQTIQYEIEDYSTIFILAHEIRGMYSVRERVQDNLE